MGALNTILNTDWQSPTGPGSQRKLPLGAGTCCMKPVRRLSVPTENTHLNVASTIRKLTRAHLLSVNELIENKIKVAPLPTFPSCPLTHSLSSSILHNLKAPATFLGIISSRDPVQKQEGEFVLLCLILSGRKPFSRSLWAELSSIMLTRIKSCAHGLSTRDAGKTVLTISSSQRGDEH